MASSTERVDSDNVIDGQIDRLIKYKLKLVKEIDLITEARDNHAVNKKEVIETSGQSILNLCKDVSEIVVKIRDQHQLKIANDVENGFEEDSEASTSTGILVDFFIFFIYVKK